MIGMEVRNIPKLRRITKAERILIAQWRLSGLSNKVIAKRLGEKGTDFSKVTAEEIGDVEWESNNRPRKRLGFKTPIRGCISS